MPRLLARFLPALCLALAAILGASGGLERAAAWGPAGRIQSSAASYLDAAERKAIEAFAAARAINATASILKSAEFTPLVVRIAPLELLEPVDDLAKQFADVMVVSLIAILLQRLLLDVAQSWALTAVLPAGCMLWLLACLIPGWAPLRLRLAGLARSLVVLAVFARCVVPLAGWAGDGLTKRFLAGDLNHAVAVMDTARGRLDTFTGPVTTSQTPATLAAPNDHSLWGWLSGATQDAARDANGLLDRLRGWMPDSAAIAQALQDVPEQIVRATEIFLVQTILVPLLTALALYRVLSSVTRPIRKADIPM
jgi:hypothetical protein